MYPQWVTMSDNLIFLGLHFVIGKCEAKSTHSPYISPAHSFGSLSIRKLSPRHVRPVHPPSPPTVYPRRPLTCYVHPRLNTREKIRRARSASSGERGGGGILFLESRPQKARSKNYFVRPLPPERVVRSFSIHSVLQSRPLTPTVRAVPYYRIALIHMLSRSSILTWRQVYNTTRRPLRRSKQPSERKAREQTSTDT